MEMIPEKLDEFQTSLDDLSKQASEAAEYVAKHFNAVQGTGLIFALVAPVVGNCSKTLTANALSIGSLSSKSAEEIGRTATRFRTAERKNRGDLSKPR